MIRWYRHTRTPTDIRALRRKVGPFSKRLERGERTVWPVFTWSLATKD